jgi:hypothetical protein
MNLRCKVFRAVDTGTLEGEVNRFLTESAGTPGDPEETLRVRRVTQSEGAEGVTLILWYSLEPAEEVLDDEELGAYDEPLSEELA